MKLHNVVLAFRFAVDTFTHALLSSRLLKLDASYDAAAFCGELQQYMGLDTLSPPLVIYSC